MVRRTIVPATIPYGNSVKTAAVQKATQEYIFEFASRDLYRFLNFKNCGCSCWMSGGEMVS